MASVSPVVRYLILCEDMVVEDNTISLLHLVLNISPQQTPPYPLVYPALCVFVTLTEARGPGRFYLQLVQADTGWVVYRTKTHSTNFGNDPLKVFGLPFRIRNCVFPAAGLYWVQFWFNDALIAEQELFLR